MEKRQLIRLVGKVLFWVAIVVLGLNLENLAEAFGYDSVLADFAQGEGFFPAVWSVMTSDLVFFGALVALGAGIAAWADHFAKKWDSTHLTHEQQCVAQSWPLRILADELERASHLPQIPAEIFSKLTSRYNTLRDLGFGAPSPPLDDPRAWFEIHQVYLRLLWPILNDGHVDLAKLESMRWNGQVTKPLSGVSQQDSRIA
ncbi:hypothetical protein [Altererythrobacter sp. MTPC7]|uniref:hypothetical protein n=1 Tax=Altererythrobacter sp. MTPC7 TaxID=3056567 RepID=UPI0036F29F45